MAFSDDGSDGNSIMRGDILQADDDIDRFDILALQGQGRDTNDDIDQILSGNQDILAVLRELGLILSSADGRGAANP